MSDFKRTSPIFDFSANTPEQDKNLQGKTDGCGEPHIANPFRTAFITPTSTSSNVSGFTFTPTASTSTSIPTFNFQAAPTSAKPRNFIFGGQPMFGSVLSSTSKLQSSQSPGINISSDANAPVLLTSSNASKQDETQGKSNGFGELRKARPGVLVHRSNLSTLDDRSNEKISSKFQNLQDTIKSAPSLSPFNLSLFGSAELDFSGLACIEVDEVGVKRKVDELEYISKGEFKRDHELAWLLRAVTCIDLTTLSGDDTASNVKRLCYKAAHPLSPNLVKSFKEDIKFDEVEKIRTAAVCVYPARVADASKEIGNFNLHGEIGVASVATGFPTGQYPLCTRLSEITYCVENGATEIDIVISRELVICGKWKELYNEIRQMRIACGQKVLLKTILATGECGSLKNVFKASVVAMLAGSDFIKTSTGKEAVNATLQVGVVMCRAIADYNLLTGKKVGLKPAGGIRTYRDAIAWLVLVKELLGKDWLDSKLFRIGASGLLGDIEKRLFYLINGYQPSPDSFFYS